jgi:hypothetical protein
VPVAINNSDARVLGSGTFASFAYGAGSGSNRLLLTQTKTNSGVSITNAYFAGTPMTNVTPNGANNLKMFRLVAPTAGSQTLSFDIASYDQMMPVTSDWTGVDQNEPLGTLANNNGTSNTPTTVSVNVQQDGVVYGASYNAYSVAPAPVISGGGNILAASTRNGLNGYGRAGGYRTSSGIISWSNPTSAVWDTQAVPIRAYYTSSMLGIAASPSGVNGQSYSTQSPGEITRPRIGREFTAD